MKYFYYFLFLLSITGLNTQAQNQDFSAQVDYYFQHLDKSQIPTDILYERVFPAAEVGRFTNTSIDTTSAFHFFTAFEELQTADYTGRWQPASTISDGLASKPHSEVPVGVPIVQGRLTFLTPRSKSGFDFIGDPYLKY